MRAIADDAEIDGYDLVDLRAVDVDVNFLRLRSERVKPSGHPVVEPRADGDDEVRPVHRHVRFVGTVHSEHAEPVRMVGGEGAEAH